MWKRRIRSALVCLLVCLGVFLSSPLRQALIGQTAAHRNAATRTPAAGDPNKIETTVEKTSNGYQNTVETRSKAGNPSRHQEVRHVAFLKVHKCASSTVTNIMYRFGMRRNLTFVVPTFGNYIRFHNNKPLLLPPHLHSKYDILCNHVDYFRKMFWKHLLPSDTMYVAIVRDPLQRIQSAFNYYRKTNLNLKKVKGVNPFETYLKNVKFYESKWANRSLLNNMMVRDFGFQYDDFKNITKFYNYLQLLDKTFHLVMVSDMFDESLLLMRRYLKWPLRDILNTRINSNKYEPVFDEKVTSQVKPFLHLDQILYDYFVSKLKTTIVDEGRGFQDELAYFRKLNERTQNFCNDKTKDPLIIGRSLWNDEFRITWQDCKLMKTSVLNLLSQVRKKQLYEIDKFAMTMHRSNTSI